MYRAYIIGCGKIAGHTDNGMINNFSHGYAYNSNNKIILSGCTDIDKKKGKIFSNQFKTNFYDNYKLGIKETNPDIVSICSPDKTHYKIVKDLFELNGDIKIIFLEKPICQNETELYELIDLSKKKNIPIVVNHTRRFDNTYINIRQFIQEEKFGKFINGSVLYYGGWSHNGVHVIDTLSFIFDDIIHVNQIKIGAKSRFNKFDKNFDAELVFSKKNGQISLQSFDDNYYQLFEFDLRFEKYRIRIEDFDSRVLVQKKIINNINENILLIDKTKFDRKNLSSIKSAVNKIVEFLDKNDKSILNGHTINDMIETMKTIWKGISLYDKY